MSTPPGHKELWKNITWKSLDEKRAFYNHYFKGSVFVREETEITINAMKERLIHFIEQGEIQEGNNKRKITLADLIKKIKEENR